MHSAFRHAGKRFYTRHLPFDKNGRPFLSAPGIRGPLTGETRHMNRHDNNLNPNNNTSFTRLNEKQRREPPRQQPPLLNTLQNIETDTIPPEPPPETGADDPFMGIPEKQRNDM